ncbi:NADH dehydrogenase [ubiquinone] 1 alpha subcomplex subunit 2 [Silurus asotus]|uniref:NADH dehydrogenase [ubiquinone] 1 alpha subcomplex subunit 2 n=1 Tax=Silurus asotus TaxID=30991 RepID=A0AAD5AAV9_SILAS|nr:NADH dehydrogenase [ubiquinone] 1 alpha subcomplex subunit 2 [Silurus asotus]
MDRCTVRRWSVGGDGFGYDSPNAQTEGEKGGEEGDPVAGRSDRKMAAAAVRNLGSSLSKNLREIRLHLCQTSAGSQGVRDFVQQHYVTLKKANPEFPILIRECSGVQPRLWARYALGKEQSVSLDNMSVDQVAKVLENAVNVKV